MKIADFFGPLKIQLSDLNILYASKTFLLQLSSVYRGLTGGWVELAIAHPVFDRIEVAAKKWRHAALLIFHPVLGSYI